MLRCLIILFVVCLSRNAFPQGDSTMITELNTFGDGLYLTHDDFRKNSPITKNDILTNIDKEQIDFFSEITVLEKITYTSGANTYTVESKKIWGFVQNKTLFMNYNGTFYRVPVLGAICYFAGIVEVTGYYNGIYDPMFGNGMGRTVKTQELTEFLISYYNGKLVSFDVDYLDALLRNDEEIYKEFKGVSKHKRKKEATRFIRKYNEKHPIYYLK